MIAPIYFQIEYNNIDINLVEYTHHKATANALAHTITRQFEVRFINELTRDDLDLKDRFHLFQQAMVLNAWKV